MVDAVIDFLFVDAMAFFEYRSIYDFIPCGKNFVTKARPKHRRWFNKDTTEELIKSYGYPYKEDFSCPADMVITTDASDVIDPRIYKGSLHVRQLYALSDKGFTHNILNTLPFDIVLCPGKYSRDKLKSYTRAIIAGFPKYDRYFRGEYKKKMFFQNAKKTILYLPTWDIYSSIDVYANAIMELCRTFNLIIKPHHCTLRFEPDRMAVLKSPGDDKICMEKVCDVAELFLGADIVMADVYSGAYYESLMLGKPTIGLALNKIGINNLVQDSARFSTIIYDPKDLLKALDSVESDTERGRKYSDNYIENLVSYRDGTAGRRTAEELMNFISMRKNRRMFFKQSAIFWGMGSNTSLKEYLSYKIDPLGRHKSRVNMTKGGVRACQKATEWIKDNTIEGCGVAVSSKKRIAYPEVTGYTIPTLYQWGEKGLARDLARWLVRRQNADGSFLATDGTPYTFDTAQVMRGFLGVLGDIPEAEAALLKGCDWIVAQVQPDGRLFTPSTRMWGGVADGRIHLYALPVLIEAGKRLGQPKYEDAARRALAYYKTLKNLVEFDTMSHFYGYILDALCDLGEDGLARSGFEKISVLQAGDGGVPAYKGVSWVCLPGTAQAAIVGYKLGAGEFSDRAMAYLEKIQNKSGGFCGSRGRGADYFPDEEVSWGAKFFLDAYYWKIKASFDKEVDIFSAQVDPDDGRVREILSFFGDIAGKKVMDAGCGKGRYLKILKDRFPGSALYGVDISDRMLSFCPEGVEVICASMLDIRYPDASFDFVYSVEALEHALFTENAVREMARILKPGAKLIIIDKDKKMGGALELKPWERWFSPDEITLLMAKYGVRGGFKHVADDKNRWPAGLFVAWEGVKDA